MGGEGGGVGSKLPVLLIWIIVGQGPIVHAVGADGGCLDIFFSDLSLPLSRRWPDTD